MRGFAGQGLPTLRLSPLLTAMSCPHALDPGPGCGGGFTPGWVSAPGGGDQSLPGSRGFPAQEWQSVWLCNTDFIEDKFHFVLVCNKFECVKNKLLNISR